MRRLKAYRNQIFYICVLLLLAGTAYRSVGPYHPDEYFQILEFSSYKFGLTAPQDLPWEFKAQIRPWFQPLVAMMPMSLGESLGLSRFSSYTLMRLFFALIMFASITFFLRSRDFFFGKQTARFAEFFWLFYFVPFFAVRISSESFCASLCFVALGIIGGNSRSILSFLGSGFFFGLSFLARLQAGSFFAGYCAWLLWKRERFWQKKLILNGCGFLGAVLLGILIDRWGYGNWVVTAYRYFHLNLVEGVANSFGVEPWYFFITQFFTGSMLKPLGGILFLGTLTFVLRRPAHVLSFIFLAFFLAASILAHKEPRFMIPACFLMAFFCLDSLIFFWEKMRVKARPFAVILISILLVANVMTLLRRSSEALREQFFLVQAMAKFAEPDFCVEWSQPFLYTNLRLSYLAPDVKASFHTLDRCPTDQVRLTRADVPENFASCTLLYQEPWWLNVTTLFFDDLLQHDQWLLKTGRRTPFRFWKCLP